MAEDTLSLYFGVRPGERADLEVVAAAAIAWSEGLRAAARAVDPDIELRVELVDADQGSHIVNTILTWVERHIEPHLERIERGAARAPRTRKLLVALAAFAAFTAPSTYDLYFGDPDFTENDREMLRELSAKVANDAAVIEARKKMFRAAEREPKITGLGIKDTPDSEPIIVVPANQFAEGGGLWSDQERMIDSRTLNPVLDVVLVRPALVHTPRNWTFRIDGLPEFEATMKDRKVLDAMSSGIPLRMREGIPMKIRMEVKEVMVDGEWRLVRGGRSVLEVLSPQFD